MKKSYNIRIQTESKRKHQHKSVTTHTFNSTKLNHMHQMNNKNKSQPDIVESPLTLNHAYKYKDYNIDQQGYLGLSPFHTNQFKVQAYRQRLSLDFRKLHKTPKNEQELVISSIKQSRGIDKSLISIKARIITQSIYEQQMKVYQQQKRLLGRIKQRLLLLKDINEEKSALVDSYFIQKK